MYLLLVIATNKPVWFKTGFVVQGHTYSNRVKVWILGCVKLAL